MISNSGTSTLGLYDFKRQLDAFGGVDYFRSSLAGGYLKNARVMLANGDIVKSTVGGNTNDPNVDMTGWMTDDNTVESVESIAEMIAIQNPKDGQIVNTKSYHAGLNKGACSYYYDITRATENNGGSIINGWVAIDITSNTEQWGAKLDGVTNDTTPIVNTLTTLGEASVYGNTVLDRFDFPEGAKLLGKANITYTRIPTIPCMLDSSISIDHTKIKAVYVYGVFDICDMLQIKTAGFNTIIHYQYAFTDGGNITKAINAAESIGLKVIINSPDDVPPPSVVALGNDRNAVLGFYLFDEPQHKSVTVEAQNTRINTWRGVTKKILCTADNGIFGFENNTISDGFDLIFADVYYIASDTDAQNKLYGVVGFSELKYKCPQSKVIPAVGLFTGDASTNKAKNLLFAQDFYKCGDGDYAAFAWDAKFADVNLTDIINDIDLYNQAKLFNFAPEHKPYKFDVNVFGNTSGLNGLLTIYDKGYSSVNIKPYAIVNVGSAQDARRQNFADRGIGIANSGGIFASTIQTHGYVACILYFYNHVDSGDVTIIPFKTVDDFYSIVNLESKVLNHSNGFISGYSVERGNSFGLNIVPSSSSEYFFKFVSGGFVSSSWINGTF